MSDKVEVSMSNREATVLYAYIQAAINLAASDGRFLNELVAFNEKLYRAMNKCQACLGFGSFSLTPGMSDRCLACDGLGWTE